MNNDTQFYIAALNEFIEAYPELANTPFNMLCMRDMCNILERAQALKTNHQNYGFCAQAAARLGDDMTITNKQVVAIHNAMDAAIQATPFAERMAPGAITAIQRSVLATYPADVVAAYKAEEMRQHCSDARQSDVRGTF
jgi:hypothetical protein